MRGSWGRRVRRRRTDLLVLLGGAAAEHHAVRHAHQPRLLCRGWQAARRMPSLRQGRPPNSVAARQRRTKPAAGCQTSRGPQVAARSSSPCQPTHLPRSAGGAAPGAGVRCALGRLWCRRCPPACPTACRRRLRGQDGVGSRPRQQGVHTEREQVHVQLAASLAGPSATDTPPSHRGIHLERCGSCCGGVQTAPAGRGAARRHAASGRCGTSARSGSAAGRRRLRRPRGPHRETWFQSQTRVGRQGVRGRAAAAGRQSPPAPRSTRAANPAGAQGSRREETSEVGPVPVTWGGLHGAGWRSSSGSSEPTHPPTHPCTHVGLHHQRLPVLAGALVPQRDVHAAVARHVADCGARAGRMGRHTEGQHQLAQWPASSTGGSTRQRSHRDPQRWPAPHTPLSRDIQRLLLHRQW